MSNINKNEIKKIERLKPDQRLKRVDKIIKKALGDQIKLENKFGIKDIDTLTAHQAYALVNTEFGNTNSDKFFSYCAINSQSFNRYFNALIAQKKFKEVVENFERLDALKIYKTEYIYANAMTAFARLGLM